MFFDANKQLVTEFIEGLFAAATGHRRRIPERGLEPRPALRCRELRISENTVEDDLKTIFSKVGVGSRRELTGRLFTEHYAQR